jgi:RNA polymerase sigma factor (sigma-70 family)
VNADERSEDRWDDRSEVFRREREALVRLAHVITGSNQVAEDVVQDAYLRWADRPGLENPAGYLRMVVVNGARDVLRRRAVAARIRFEEPVRLGEPELDETWAIVRDLPERYRTALALRFYEDLPEAQIAAVMQVRVGTVKSLIHRGLERVRKELES